MDVMDKPGKPRCNNLSTTRQRGFLRNSRDEYFIGPEVTAPVKYPMGFYKDATGALKRQAARFRVYGLNAAGKVVKELTADNAQLTWRVHIL
jgi:hypothetical protein